MQACGKADARERIRQHQTTSGRRLLHDQIKLATLLILIVQELLTELEERNEDARLDGGP